MKKQQNSIGKIGSEIEQDIKKELKLIDRYRKKNEDKLLFAAFITVLCALIIINAIYIINRVSTRQKIVTAAQTLNFPKTVLPSTVSGVNSSFTVAVKGVKEDSTPDPAFAFDAQETMLIATVTITNTSGKKQQLSAASQLYVRSQDGSYFAMHPSSRVQKELGSKEVAPGETVTGDVSFAIPKILTKPLLYVDLGWNDFVPVVFDVLH